MRRWNLFGWSLIRTCSILIRLPHHVHAEYFPSSVAKICRYFFWQPRCYQSGPAIAQGDSSAERLWLLRLLGLGDDAFAIPDPSKAANCLSQASLQQSCQITCLLQEPACEVQLGPRYRDKCDQDSFGEGVQRRGS